MSFKESGPNYLKINGITQLVSADDAIIAAQLGKNIRHPADPNYQPGNLIDLRDLKDSPENQSPPWSSPADPLDEIVTFFVTDGTYVTSAQIHIKAADQGFDVAVTDLVSRPDLLIGNI